LGHLDSSPQSPATAGRDETVEKNVQGTDAFCRGGHHQGRAQAVIYADPSFLFSFYAWDKNSEVAARTYSADARRPLFLTPWQRFETRNAVRRSVWRLKGSKLPVPFQPGSVFKDMQDDLDTGRLQHAEEDWRESLRVAEDLNVEHTDDVGTAAGALWHVAAAILLEADTFWTFDGEQRAAARACGPFRRVPELAAA
jgi:hypothetical protein